MSIYRRNSDGRWYVKFPAGTIKEDPSRTSIHCGTGVLGEEKARRLNIELGLEKKRRKIGPAFSDLAAAYLESRRADMAETTYNATYYCLHAHLLPFFGKVNVYDIDPSLLDEYVKARREPQEKRGKKIGKDEYEIRIVHIKNVTINRELSIVKAVMSWGHGREIIASNKIAGYRLPKRDDLVVPPPTLDELAAILKNAAPHLRRAIILSFYVGLRPGKSELLSLEWSDVDFINRTIFIESAKKGGIQARHIPLNEILFKHLSSWYDEDKDRKKMPVQIIHYNGRPVERLKTAWNAAKRRARITRPLKLYNLRHATTTALLSAGYDPGTVSLITGNTVEVMLKKYNIAPTSYKADALGSMPDITGE